MRPDKTRALYCTFAALLLSTAAIAQTPAHLDNPFVGANFYRNADYVAAVNAAANLQGGALGQQMRRVANFSTWIPSRR
jgi:cellulose 1,4-beta-cellobiosidase